MSYTLEEVVRLLNQTRPGYGALAAPSKSVTWSEEEVGPAPTVLEVQGEEVATGVDRDKGPDLARLTEFFDRVRALESASSKGVFEEDPDLVREVLHVVGAVLLWSVALSVVCLQALKIRTSLENRLWQGALVLMVLFTVVVAARLVIRLSPQ